MKLGNLEKLTITGILILLGIVFFSPNAKADTILITEPGNQGNIPITSGYINKAISTFNLNTPNGTFRILLQNASGTIATSNSTNAIGTGSTPTWFFSNIEFSFPTAINLELYKTYYLITQLYWNNNWISVPGGGSSNTAYYETPTPINLSFQYPFDQTSINSNFTHFQINANNPATSIQGVSLEIWLAENSNFTNKLKYTDYQTHILQPNTTSTFDIQRSGLLKNNTTYYAKVLNLGTNSSSTISFNTGEIIQSSYTGQPENWIYTTSTLQSTSTEVNPFYIDCSEYDSNWLGFLSADGIACAIKKGTMGIIGFLVTPTDESSELLKNTISTIGTVYPFSLVTQTINSVKSAIENNITTTTSNLEINIPQIGLTGTMLSPTYLEDNIGTTSKDIIFSIERYIIWAGVGIALIAIIL